MEGFVFVVTAVTCALFTIITKKKVTIKTFTWNDIDRRLQMLELVEQMYVPYSKLSFTPTAKNDVEMHINIHGKIKEVSICMNEIIDYNGSKAARNVRNTDITHITVYDRNSRAQTIESENDENKFNRRFIIEPPLLFQKIEFFCNNNVVNNMTTINFRYNTTNGADNELYGRSITAKSYHGKHIICNDSEMSIEYDILKYFSTCAL